MPTPKFFKVVRELVKAGAFREDSEINPLDLDAYIREETQGEYGINDAKALLDSISSEINAKNLGRSAVQGALFNFGDEIIGALPGGEARAEKMRLEDDLFKQEHPVVDAVAGAAGGIAVPGGMMARGLRNAASLPRAVTLGAGAGAAYGAGGAEPGERLVGAAKGAATGAATGPLVPGAMRAMQAVAGMRPSMAMAADAAGAVMNPKMAAAQYVLRAARSRPPKSPKAKKLPGLQANIDLLLEGLLKPARPLRERVLKGSVPVGMGGLLSDY